MIDYLDRFLNPILVREMRGRLRGRKSYLALTVFVLIAAGAFFLIFMGLYLDSRDANAADLGRIGRKAFEAMSFLLMGLVFLFTPAFSATVIALEREKKTLEFLELTLLTPSEIVRGKLLASLLYVILLLVTSLPLLSLVFILGGVSPTEIATVYAVLFLEALVLATVGVHQSAHNEKSGPATIASYFTSWFVVWFLAAIPMSAMGGSSPFSSLTRAEIPWFGGSVNALLAVALFCFLAVTMALEFAAAQLRNPEFEESFGERLAAGLLALVFVVFIGGACAGKPSGASTATFAASAFAPMLVVETMLVLACGLFIVSHPLTLMERRLPGRGVVAMAFSPRHSFSNRLLSFPAYVVILASLAALAQWFFHWLDNCARAEFTEEWLIGNAIVIVFGLGFSTFITAWSYAFSRFLPDLPRVLRTLFAGIVAISVFSAELGHSSVFSRHAQAGGLPIFAAPLVYLSPFKAFNSIDVPGARTQATHSFPGEKWTDLAYCPVFAIPGWIGFIGLWLLIALFSMRALVWMRRFDRQAGGSHG